MVGRGWEGACWGGCLLQVAELQAHVHVPALVAAGGGGGLRACERDARRLARPGLVRGSVQGAQQMGPAVNSGRAGALSRTKKQLGSGGGRFP